MLAVLKYSFNSGEPKKHKFGLLLRFKVGGCLGVDLICQAYPLHLILNFHRAT